MRGNEQERASLRTLVLPVLKHIPAKQLAEETALAVSRVKAARNGHTNPHSRNRKTLIHAAAAFARERLRAFGITPPTSDLASCVMLLASMTSLGTR